MSRQRRSKKKQERFSAWVPWMVGAFVLFMLSMGAAILNPSLKFLLWWSFWLFFVGLGVQVLLHTWALLNRGLCPQCGGELKLPPWRESIYCDGGSTYKFTCARCGHVVDSGIRQPWTGRLY